jgi:hypothetical protein
MGLGVVHDSGETALVAGAFVGVSPARRMRLVMQTIVIHQLRQVIDAANLADEWAGGQTCWWRGQADVKWELKPSIFRDDHSCFREGNIARRFMQSARARHTHCPQDDDVVAWLFMMQHYGLPTRLLDWSLSPLVAVHFACHSHFASDGVLYCTGPAELNHEQIGVDPRGLGIASPRARLRNPDRAIDFEVRALFAAAIEGVPGHLVERWQFSRIT